MKDRWVARDFRDAAARGNVYNGFAKSGDCGAAPKPSGVGKRCGNAHKRPDNGFVAGWYWDGRNFWRRNPVAKAA